MPPPKRSPKRPSSSLSKPKPRPRPPGRAESRTIYSPKPFTGRPGRPDPVSTDREPSKNGPRVVSNVVSIDKLAGSAVTIASAVEHAVFEEHRRADRAIAFALKSRRDLAAPDCRFIARAVFALFRWRGWIETLHLDSMEHRLLLAWLMDQPAVHPACKVWARSLGKDPERLYSYGGAPTWTARGEGWKRLNEGRIVSADPWRLFPDWLREQLPLPPGGASPKLKYLEFLQILQTPSPLWVRAQGTDEQAIWTELTSSGLKPWIHRKLTRAAKLEAEADVHHLPAFERGDLEIQDLASQAVALACDPDPGERWWDVCAGAGGKSLHLAALMKGKGLVVATDVHELRLKEAARRAKRSPFRNLTTKPWDGKHVVGKTGTYHGVLVDAPCSAVGTWRRNPDARWTLDALAVARLAELQAQILKAASAGVRPGGTLVYSVCTLTLPETQNIIRAFLAENPRFQLDPFPHPILGTPTDGTLLIWPQESDTDAMFIARMVRTG
jgi:16S rRNA (cytosine967-C5)-methyltransferase